jgi:hypothetical protein
VTLGLPCIVENTAYIAYGGTDSPGGEFIDIVSRFVVLLFYAAIVNARSSGNCHIDLYCDSQQKVCVQSKQLGQACSADKEFVLFERLLRGLT